MVKSPCTNVCAIDHNIGFCMGCKRTVKEITNWPSLNDIEKKKILLKNLNRKTFVGKSQKNYQKSKY